MGAINCTISTHNGSEAHRDHNIRNEKVVGKEAHIEKGGRYEIWLDESPRRAYHRIFDEAVEKYNKRQTRADRKIKNYYAQIEKDAKKHPVYEMIIGVYPDKEGLGIDEETQREILKEFVDGWKERNPNLEMIGAYFHADEEGEPHVHLDYIPVAHGYSKGMETQTGLVKALEEQGFTKQGKATAQIQWEQRENKHLEELCKARGLNVLRPTEEKREHLETAVYKAQKSLEANLEHTKDLLDIQDELRAETSKLEAKRDKAEEQADKAIKRKARAFSKSYKKDKGTGWVYDESLKKEIKSLLSERANDVAEIKHTDLDVAVALEEARTIRNTAREEAEKLSRRAESELEKARDLRKRQDELIQDRANREAERLFKAFIDREYRGEKKDRQERLEEMCQNLKLKDGRTLLEAFEERERKREEEIRRSWERSRGLGR